MRIAQRKNAKIVIIVGEEEWSRRSVVVKDMQGSSQEEVGIDVLSDKIRQLTAGNNPAR